MSYMVFGGKDRQKAKEDRERQEKELEDRKRDREKRMAERARVLEEQEKDLEKRRKEREARLAKLQSPSPPSQRKAEQLDTGTTPTTMATPVVVGNGTSAAGETPKSISSNGEPLGVQQGDELLSTSPGGTSTMMRRIDRERIEERKKEMKLIEKDERELKEIEKEKAKERERFRKEEKKEEKIKRNLDKERERQEERDKKERERKLKEDDRRRDEEERDRREIERREEDLRARREKLQKDRERLASLRTQQIQHFPPPASDHQVSVSPRLEGVTFLEPIPAPSTPVSKPITTAGANRFDGAATAPPPRTARLVGQLSDQNLKSRARLKFSDTSDEDDLVREDADYPERTFDPSVPLPKLRANERRPLKKMDSKSKLEPIIETEPVILVTSQEIKTSPTILQSRESDGEDSEGSGDQDGEGRRKKKARSLRYQHMIQNLERIRKDKEDELLKKRAKRNSRELRKSDVEPISRSTTTLNAISSSPPVNAGVVGGEFMTGSSPAIPVGIPLLDLSTPRLITIPPSEPAPDFSISNNTSNNNGNLIPPNGEEKKGTADTPMRTKPPSPRIKALKGDVLAELKRTRIKKLGTLAAAIEMSDLKLERKLGEGSFGVVYLGYCFEGPVAIKVPKLDINQLDDQEMEYLLNEINVMATNNHPHIVSCLGASTDRANFAIVLELLDGDLDDLFYGKNSVGREMSLYQRMNFAKDAAIGMNWLHSIKPAIIHRDLKLENLMYKKIEGHYTVKICDFGLSVIKPEKKRLIGRGEGNVLTMAPEIMLGQEYNTKADVYSFSMILWQLYSGENLFPGLVEFEDFVEAVCLKEERPPIPETCLPELAELMNDCWQKDQDKRPTFKEINIRLDDILIHAAIRDLPAAIWWRSSFGLKRADHLVEWEEFIDFFCEKLDLPAPHDAKEMKDIPKNYWRNIVCLKEILCTRNKGRGGSYSVHIERFGQIVNCFGPLKPTTNKTILDTIRSILKKKWFHGDLSGHDAMKRIANAPMGTFIVRFSHSSNHCFASTIRVEESKVVHARINRTSEGKFYLEEESHAIYDSLIELVQKRFDFGIPCSDWPFGSCFRFDPSLLDLIVDPDATVRRDHVGSDYRQRGYIQRGELVDADNFALQKKKAELRAEIDKLRKERASGRQ
eukprot:TRINITY_DN762_c0_g1_i9.p1 TRINITY_DN762_c0_g1~~TRINITY_DN762_c0_g1_i9.p1  ORF type:complete len:1141 (+),score=200.87 TRINITY_DN762_c0_g1_i9:21-3443(+)